MKINGIPVQSELVSGTNIKTINSTSLLGSGDVAVQATLVSGTNIVTINSTSLLGSGNLVVSASPSGVAGAIQFSDGSAFSSDATNFFWDDTNNRLGVGTNTLTARTQIKGTGATNATTSLLVQNSAGTNSLQCTDDLSVFSHGKGGITSNTIFGKGAFQGTSPSGTNSTAFGVDALAIAGGGGSNTAIGSAVLTTVVRGSNNTCVGHSAGSIGNFSNSTIIGSGAIPSTAGAINTAVGTAITCANSFCTILGNAATSTANNQFVVGSSSTNAGAVAAEVNTSANVWNIIINGVARKILLA